MGRSFAARQQYGHRYRINGSGYQAPVLVERCAVIQTKIIRLGEQRFLWYFCSHHLLLDGYGTYLLIHQVAQAYRGQTQQPQDVPAIDALLRAESEYKQSAAYQADRHFWQAASASLPDPMTLACANIPSGQTIRHVTSLPYPAERLALQNRAPFWLARTFVVVMAYLYLCTGEKQQTIGVPMMARTDSPDEAGADLQNQRCSFDARY